MSSTILVEGSARHVHVTQEHLETLFGAGAALHPKRDLSQPGQYLSDEKVRLEGPKGAIDRISILGPCRPFTQVELSLTDARALGIEVPVRESGNIAGSAPIKIVGPAGSVELQEGAIAAKRHIHLRPEDAQKIGIQDKQIVSVKTLGDRSVTFHEVVARVSEKFMPAMHLDFDEMNAALLSGEVHGEIILD
jgi:putative phosphotransacetylase